MNLRNFAHKSNFIFETSLFGETTTYTVQECNLPGVALNAVETSHRGMKLSFQGDTLEYNELNLTFILSENFENWLDIMRHINNMREIGGDTGRLDEKPSILYVQDENAKNIFKLNFFNSKVTNISDVEFSSNEDDDEEITFTITIKYDYYKIEK